MQIDLGFLRQANQKSARPLVKPRIRGMGDGFFHHGRVDRDPLQALVRHRTSGAARLDGLGQQPFDTFLADALAPAHQRRGIDRRAVLE